MNWPLQFHSLWVYPSWQGFWFMGEALVLNNSSDLSASDFITYIIIFTQVLNPAKEISRAASSIQRGLASADRIFKVVDTPSEIQECLRIPVIIDTFRKGCCTIPPCFFQL
jgi:ATP-binding cassette, subfamily B, bacterial MsbA